MSAVPNLHQLLLCRAHLNACARAHPHRAHSQGHLYLALPPQLYALETADAYPLRAADPGATATYANNAGDVSRRRVDNTFSVEKRDYDDERTMDHALSERLYEMLGTFSDDVRDEAKGIGNPTFLQVYDLATAEWGYSTPEQRTANLDGITSTTWHPSEGIKTLIRRAKTAIVYSITTGHRIPDQIVVDKVLGQIVKSRAFITAYEAFKQLPTQDFASLQVHFKKAERDNRECRDSAEQHGYGMGADETAANEMTKNLTDLAQALRQNETANGASNPSDTSTLEQIKNGMVSLQQQMLSTQQQQQQMAASMQAQANNFQMGNQMAQRPPLQDWNGNSGNGSGGGGGGGNNNRNNRNKGNNGYNNNNNNGGSNNSNTNGNEKNPYKRFDNWNYCHSCGFDVASTHSSRNCSNQLMGHQFNATRQNTMNGSNKASHKNILPTAAGRVCQEVRDQQRAAKRTTGGNRGGNNNNNFQQQPQQQQQQQQFGGGMPQQQFGGMMQQQQQNFWQQQPGGYLNNNPMFQQPNFQQQQQQGWGNRGF